MTKNFSFDFIKHKNKYFIFSIALFLVIVLWAIIFGVKMDIQFKGGTIITYAYEGTVDAGEIADVVKSAIGKDASVALKGGISGKDSFDINLAESKGLTSDEQSKITQAIEAKYGNNIEFLSNSSVDPIIGKEFLYKSIIAVLFSFLLLVTYVGIRFKKIGGWSAGSMAVVALLHDVVVITGTFIIFGIPLNDNFIAVVLTILGYSINDTIIIYDRVRENKKLMHKSTPIGELVNTSLNETLSRTINTSVTTIGAMVIISIVALVMGVNSILSFSFTLTLGLLSGTYSTIFIAGPLWVMWKERKSKKTSE